MGGRPLFVDLPVLTYWPPCAIIIMGVVNKVKKKGNEMTNESKTLKTELKKEIERELKLAESREQDYWNDWKKATAEMDKTGAEIADDLGHLVRGEIMAYKRMAKWLEIYGGLYEDGAERELELEAKGGRND